MDFDRHGNLFYSTNVGGFVMLHGVQGGYYWKQVGKHGALHNPYAYGYIDHVPHQSFRGGHVTVGGIIYRGDSFPQQFQGKYIAGDLLGHAVYWHNVSPCGSSFQSSHGGELLLANDTWFATSDLTSGPDGSIYVADWFDRRTAHPDPDADWDRTNGRIYKIEARGTKAVAQLDLARLSSDQLVELLSHPNDWYVRKARRILADRRDPHVVSQLRNKIFQGADDHLALESLWALYASGGFDEEFALKLLGHRNPDVRRWTVQVLGDECRVGLGVAARLAAMAATESDVTVRSQLASTAKRLPPADGLAIVQNLLLHDEDAGDAHIPVLLWWAVERNAVPAMDRVLAMFDSPLAWKRRLVRDHILERLIRRYAAEGSTAAEAACVRLLKSAPTVADRERLVAAVDLGIQERSAVAPRESLGTLFSNYATSQPEVHPRRMRAQQASPLLKSLLIELWQTERNNVPCLQLLSHLGEPAAQEHADRLALDVHTDVGTRQMMIQIVGETAQPRFLSALMALIAPQQPEPVQLAALQALQQYDQPQIAPKLIGVYAGMNDRLRSHTRQMLLSRKSWALALLEEVDGGQIAAKEFAIDELRQIALLDDQQLNSLVHKYWGDVRSGTPEEKLAEMRRLSNDLRARPGNPANGRLLFNKHCAICHRLYDEGNRVGPELTYANRRDREFLLVSLVDPSAVIRKEYVSYVIHTDDGRALSGLLVAQSPHDVTLLNAKNERTIIPRTKIESIAESPTSLMPENLLKQLNSAEVCDLFSYLQGDKPLASRK